MTKDPAALAFIKIDLGYQQAPVVYTEGPYEDGQALDEGFRHWSGFNADAIKAIVK